MKAIRHLIALLAISLASFTTVCAQDPLPSWNDTAPKKAIVRFVEKVTKEGSPGFLPAAERIATFDNDGTLWAEQPMYFQMFFALRRVGVLAPKHPEWKDKEPFASLLKGDVKGALAGGEKAIGEIVMTTHSGMTTEEFEQVVKDWIATAKNPKTDGDLQMLQSPPPAADRASACMSTIPTPNGSGLMIGSRTSASSTRASTKRRRMAGLS